MTKAQYKMKDILSPGFEMPESYEDQVKIYRTLAKAADQRLVRLERLTEQENFKIAEKWAYARAQRDIRQWSGEGADRFNTKAPPSSSGVLAKIKDIKLFLETPTSTKSGIKNIYQKKANTINDKYGTEFKWDQVGKFFESKLFEKLAKDYASKTVMKIIGTIQSKKKDVIKAIETSDTKDIRVPDNMVGDMAKTVISQYGDQVKDLLLSK